MHVYLQIIYNINIIIYVYKYTDEYIPGADPGYIYIYRYRYKYLDI